MHSPPSSGLVIVNIVIWVAGAVVRAWRKPKHRRDLPEPVENLDHAERAVLHEFCILAKNVVELPCGTVIGLMSKGILCRESNAGPETSIGLLLPFSIAPIAIDYLPRKVLGIPDGEPTPEQRDTLLGAQPSFAKAIENFR